MKYILPQILKDKLASVEAEIIEELKKLITRMQELNLKDIGYKFQLENGDEVVIREVLIEDEILSFAVEEYFDDDSGAKFTVIAEEITTDNLLALYNMYYANNINTIKAVG